MPRYRLVIEYDGSMFAGWQVQRGQRTVQGALQNCLTTIAGRPVRLMASGRTDAGVHATGQVAHFDVDAELDAFRLRRSINGLLGDRFDAAAVVLFAEKAPDTFHARYDAFLRRYHYAASGLPRAIDRHHRWLLRPEPDWKLMNEAAQHFLGRHHFGSFCITGSTTENRICVVSRAEWLPEERPGDWRFVIEANRFLHGMVRAIVGTLRDVGNGRTPVSSIPEILAARDRRCAGPSAPAHGLTLASVSYPDGFGIRASDRG